MIDFIVVAIIALCLCGILYYYIRSKKNGKSVSCSGCSHCTIANCDSKKGHE